MNYPLFCFLLLFLTTASIWIGKKTSKKLSTTEDYFLGGRSIGIFPLTMTLLATQLGGALLMGGAEEAYRIGWGVIFYPLGMVLGLLLLGFGFGAKLRSMNLTTVAELFEKKFGSTFLRKVASLLSIFSLFLILITQAIAAKKFFTSLGFDGGVLFTLFWFVLIFYTVMGGLKAVVQTDVLQALFILLAFAITFGWVIFGRNNLSFSPEIALQPRESVVVPWFNWLVMPLLFMLIEQDMGQRCFAAKTTKTVSLSSIFAALLLLIAAICPIFFGIMAYNANIEIKEGASVLMSAAGQLTNPTICAFLVCAILMAIISTADSLLCSVSSNLACDFEWMRKQPLLFSRGLTTVVGVSSLICAFFFDNVIEILMFSYELTVSALCIPVFFGVVLKKPKKLSAFLGIACGMGGYFLFQDFAFRGLWTLAFSAVAFLACELFYRPLIATKGT